MRVLDTQAWAVSRLVETKGQEAGLHSPDVASVGAETDVLQNGRAAAKALLAACQSLCAGATAFRALIGHHMIESVTDNSLGAIRSIATHEHRLASLHICHTVGPEHSQSC